MFEFNRSRIPHCRISLLLLRLLRLENRKPHERFIIYHASLLSINHAVTQQKAHQEYCRTGNCFVMLLPCLQDFQNNLSAEIFISYAVFRPHASSNLFICLTLRSHLE